MLRGVHFMHLAGLWKTICCYKTCKDPRVICVVSNLDFWIIIVVRLDAVVF